jgi:hypothetical protein
MAGIMRKQFLEQFAAGCLASALPLRSFAGDAASPTANGPLMIPYPAKPWAQGTRIVGDRPQLRLDELKAWLQALIGCPCTTIAAWCKALMDAGTASASSSKGIRTRTSWQDRM